jgi:hypothetical protein
MAEELHALLAARLHELPHLLAALVPVPLLLVLVGHVGISRRVDD